MEALTAYARIARKIDEQEPHTAPKAADGSIHEAFIGHLKLVYSPEEAEIVQHLDVLESFTSAEEVAEASGKSLEYVSRILEDAHSRNSLLGLGNMYCLPPIPLLINMHHFYPEIREGDVEAAKLHEEYFVKSGFYKKYETVKKGMPVGRVIPIDRAIEADQKVLAGEEAHDFILNHSSDQLALVPCPCRTRTEKLGTRECKDEFPIAACIMMGAAATHFEMLGLGKPVSKAAGDRVLRRDGGARSGRTYIECGGRRPAHLRLLRMLLLPDAGEIGVGQSGCPLSLQLRSPAR